MTERGNNWNDTTSAPFKYLVFGGVIFGGTQTQTRGLLISQGKVQTYTRNISVCNMYIEVRKKVKRVFKMIGYHHVTHCDNQRKRFAKVRPKIFGCLRGDHNFFFFFGFLAVLRPVGGILNICIYKT